MFSKYKGLADITLLSRNMLGKSMNSIPLLMNGILMKCLMWLKHASTDKRRNAPLRSECKTKYIFTEKYGNNNTNFVS